MAAGGGAAAGTRGGRSLVEIGLARRTSLEATRGDMGSTGATGAGTAVLGDGAGPAGGRAGGLELKMPLGSPGTSGSAGIELVSLEKMSPGNGVLGGLPPVMSMIGLVLGSAPGPRSPRYPRSLICGMGTMVLLVPETARFPTCHVTCEEHARLHVGQKRTARRRANVERAVAGEPPGVESR